VLDCLTEASILEDDFDFSTPESRSGNPSRDRFGARGPQD